MNEDIEKKINSLEDRIEHAREDVDDIFVDEGDEEEDDRQTSAARGADIGYMFLALVISGWLIGFGIDRFFDTSPWGMLIMTVLGMISGVYRANHEMNKKE